MPNLSAAVVLFTAELAKVSSLPALIHSPWSEQEMVATGLYISDMQCTFSHGTIRRAVVTDATIRMFVRANFAYGDLDQTIDPALALMDIIDEVSDQLITAATAGTFTGATPSFTARLADCASGTDPEYGIGTILFEFELQDFQ